jgi:hypothetical protein
MRSQSREENKQGLMYENKLSESIRIQFHIWSNPARDKLNSNEIGTKEKTHTAKETSDFA